MKQNKAKNYFYFTMLSKAFEAINSLDDEGLKNRDSLLGVLDSFLVTLKKPIKNILYNDAIACIRCVINHKYNLQKTLTGVPYVLYKSNQKDLLNLLYTLINDCNNDSLIDPNILEFRKYSPFSVQANQALYVGASHKNLWDLSNNELNKFYSSSRMIVENMMLEYAILIFYYDRDTKYSVFRDRFMSILLFCCHSSSNPNISMKFCLRESLKVLILSTCHKWFIPSLIDMRKQIVNFKNTDIIGRLIINNEELFPRVPIKAHIGDYKYDNGTIDSNDKDAIELIKIMSESAIKLTEKTSFTNIIENIDYILTTDLLSKDNYVMKDKYTVTKITQNEKTQDNILVLSQATLTYL